MAAGAASVSMVHIDTSGMVNVPTGEIPAQNQPGFTVWPAQSSAGQFNLDNGGTEYFMSSNAADEATHPVAGTGGNYVSNQLVVWALKNTSSLNSASPALSLSNKVVGVETYALPPRAKQPGSGAAPGVAVAQGYCLNDETTVTIAGTGCCSPATPSTLDRSTFTFLRRTSPRMNDRLLRWPSSFRISTSSCPGTMSRWRNRGTSLACATHSTMSRTVASGRS